MPGNHRLDFQEFTAFMETHTQDRDQEAELREAFQLFDRDNSGFITMNELKQVAFFLSFSFSIFIRSLLRQDHVESG
jgi:Ca2+-binding EF-hand superfamily protein